MNNVLCVLVKCAVVEVVGALRDLDFKTSKVK